MDPQRRPRLRPDVELLRGMDDAPLAYDPRTGAYHRLSEPAYALVRSLDGSRTLSDLAGAIAARRGGDAEAARTNLAVFLGTLDRSGLLDGAGPAGPTAPARRRRSWLLRGVVVTRALPRLLEPVARLLRPGRRAAVLLAVLAVLGPVGMVAGLVTVLREPPVRFPGWIGLAVLVVYLVQICLHEATHALVAQVLDVPVRGAGVALVLGVLPYLYVDRTDAYRVRSRTARVALVSGPVLLDGVFLGVTAMANGPFARTLLGLQAFTLLMNLNPLLPSDGYAAIEAATGLVDPRGRALALLSHAIRRRPLPAYLAALSRRSRLAHLGYGVLSVLYFGLVGYVVVGAGLIALSRLG